MEVHVNASATELHALHSETEALFGGGFAFELDLAAGAYYSLPWESLQWCAAEEACDCSMVEGIARGCGYFAVGRDFSSGDGTDDAPEGGVARLVVAEGILEDSPLEILRDSRAAHEQNCIRGDWTGCCDATWELQPPLDCRAVVRRLELEARVCGWSSRRRGSRWRRCRR